VVGEPLAVLVGKMVPQLAEQAAPFCVRLQVTPLPRTSFETVAVNCSVKPAGTFAEVGEIETAIACTTIVAKTDWVVSAAEVAVSVTVMGECGAL